MVKKKIFCLMFFFVLISLVNVSAYTTQKQSTDYTLSITSNNATSCNLSSIQYPDGTNTIYNLQLTKNGNLFYNTITSENYTQLGTTCHHLICTDGSSYEDGSLCLDVTPSGLNLTVGIYVLFLIVSAGLVIFGFYIKDNWVIVLGGFAMVFIGLFQLFYGISGFKDNTYTWALGIIFLMTGSYFSVRGAYEALS